MSDKFATEMRRKLIGIREELEAVVQTGEEHSAVVELDQSRVGRLSRMDALQAQAIAQESGHRRHETLRQIESALARIEDGNYGDCQACDETIDRKRLAFDPTARLCIECANKAEL